MLIELAIVLVIFGILVHGDACSPPAHGYAVGFADGVTVLADGVAPLALTSTVTDVAFKVVNGTVWLYFGQGDGVAINAEGSYEGKTVYKRLNWREVPTSDWKGSRAGRNHRKARSPVPGRGGRLSVGGWTA